MRRTEGGMGLVWLFSIPLVLIGLVILGFIYTLVNQAYWDKRVEEMCEKDGGRIVYERVFLSEEEYGGMLDSAGNLRIPTRYRLKEDDDYVSRFESKALERRALGLVIKEASTRVIRVKNEKVIAEQVDFIRVGGDFPFSASQASSFGCPKPEEKPFLKEIFIVD